MEWGAQRVVDTAQAAELIGQQFAPLRDCEVELLGIGWDNTVHLVNDEWAFRFPRREVAVVGVLREMAVLPQLAGRLPSPVPSPVWLGEPSGEYPWPFWGGAFLPGRELGEGSVPEDGRGQIAADLGRFLRCLHDLDSATNLAVQLPHDPMERADASFRAGKATLALHNLAGTGSWSPDAAVMDLLHSAAGAGAPEAAPVMTHGDLHIRHVLVDDQHGLAGVIDWGDVCVADPAVDVSIAFSAFAGESRARFLSEYGDISEDTELRARVLAVNLCALLAEYALAQGLPALERESLRGIGRAIA